MTSPQHILGTLVRLQIFTQPRAQAVWQEYQNYCHHRGQSVPLAQYLWHNKLVSPEQWQQVQSLISQSPATPVPSSQPATAPSSRPSTGRDPALLRRGTLPQYKVLKVLGEGGYGKVYQVRDELTDRKMALKVLHGTKAQKPQVKKRFLREIQITSLLEHPHIMPVYESGYLDDNSLFFVMKEFQGGSLQDILHRIHKGSGETDISLRDLLDVFLKVCQAVEYAHSQGVIHRDLKPDNIAVGDFGEVMVMDWGIAKNLGQTDEVEEQTDEIDLEKIETAGDEELEVLTQAGGIMGTPGYLSPEQAKGTEIDERSDVYGLGAVLYCILTGTPPFVGGTKERLVHVLMKDPEPPEERVPHREIPLELSAIALKALAHKPYQRYPSAGELRRDVVRFLEGFSVTARRDPWWARTVKWARRNKAWAVSASAAVLLVLASLVALSTWQKIERQNEIDGHLSAAQKVLDQSSLATATALKEEFPTSYQGAGEESREAKGRRETSIDLHLQARRELEKAYQLAPESDEIREKLFEVEREIGRLALLGRDYLFSRTAFQRCAALAGDEVGKKLVGQIETRKKELARVYLARLEKIRKELARKPPAEGMVEEYTNEIVKMPGTEIGPKLMAMVKSRHKWVRRVAVEALGRRGVEKGTDYDVVKALIDRLHQVDVKTQSREALALIWALGRLRDSRAHRPVQEARRRAGRHSALARKTDVPFGWIPFPKDGEGVSKTDPYQALLQRGEDKGHKKKFDEARQLFEQAIRLRPQDHRAYLSLGKIYIHLNRPMKSIECYDKALQQDPQNPLILANRAFAQSRLGRYSDAAESYSQAIAMGADSSQIYQDRASVLLEMGKLKESFRDYETSLKKDPENVASLHGRASIYEKWGRWKKALADYNRILKIDGTYHHGYLGRGRIYRELKLYQKALADWQQAIDLKPQSHFSYGYQADLFHKMGRHKKAVQLYQQAVDLSPKSSFYFHNRGNVYKSMKRFDQALADYNRAIELNPKEGIYYYSRGWLLVRQKDFSRAYRDFTRAIQLNPNLIRAYHNRGVIAAQRKNFDQAIADYSRAIDLAPDSPDLAQTYFNRGYVTLYHKRNPKKAIPDLRKAATFLTRDQELFYHLGIAYYSLQDYDGAIHWHRKILAVNPRHHKAHMQLGHCHAMKKERDQAFRYFNQALKIKESANGYYNRGVVYYQQEQYEKALSDFRNCLRLKPNHRKAKNGEDACLKKLGRR